MQYHRLLQRLFVGLLFYFGILLFAACGNNQASSPFAPVAEGQTGLSKKGSGSGGTTVPDSDLLLVRKREDAENGVSTAVIGPEGGVLIHAAHRVEVPAGALTDSVELTFSMPVSDTLMFELGPDGVQFNAPVKVIFNYDHTFKSGLDKENFKVAVWNPETQTWDLVPTTVDTEANEVNGDTNHFSRYAISKG